MEQMHAIACRIADPAVVREISVIDTATGKGVCEVAVGFQSVVPLWRRPRFPRGSPATIIIALDSLRAMGYFGILSGL